MSQTVVEISGDEAGLLRSLRNVIEKEKEHERQLLRSGEAGAKGANDIETAMERVKVAADNQLKGYVQDLGRIGPEGRKFASALKGHFVDAGKAGYESIESIIGKIRQLDPEAATAMEAVKGDIASAAAASDFEETLAGLQRLGPEGAAIAAGIRADMATAATSAANDMDEILASLSAIRPEVATSAERIKSELADAARESDFRETLAALQKLGPEGAAVAAGIRDDLATASAAAAGDMDEIVARLAQLRPEAATSAERIKSELADAARFSEGKFEETLTTLRSMGPVGRQVAAELKTSLVNAGELAEQSIDDVVASLRRISPEAADAAASIHTRVQEQADKSKSSFKSFGESAIGQITQIAGAYIGVQEAIQFVIAANQKVIETNKEIFEGLKTNQSADKRLLQVSDTSEQFDAYRKQADELATTYGIDREEARNLVFEASSGEFEGALDFIASNSQSIDVADQADVASKVPTLFRKEALTPEQAINANLQAARNTNLDFGDISSSFPVAASGTSATGGGAAETAAALATLAPKFGSGATAADRIKALGTKLDLDQDYGLADIGLTAGVEKIQSLPEEDRRKVLGDSSELNQAYNAYIDELEKIKESTQSVQAAIDSTGTAESPTAKRRAISDNNPEMKAIRDAAIAENQLAIAREDRRAVTEGERQTDRSRALRNAENSPGTSEFSIAVAENVAQAATGFGFQNEGDIIRTVSGDSLTNLERDLNLAYDRGDQTTQPALLATNRLATLREADPDAVLSRDDVATYVRGTTGDKEFLPSQVSEDLQLDLTNVIVEQASQSRGSIRSATVAAVRGLGRTNGYIAGTAAVDGTNAAADLSRLMPALLERNTAALEKLNELNERSAAAAEKTASNTTPRDPDPNAITTAIAAQSDARAAR